MRERRRDWDFVVPGPGVASYIRGVVRARQAQEQAFWGEIQNSGTASKLDLRADASKLKERLAPQRTRRNITSDASDGVMYLR